MTTYETSFNEVHAIAFLFVEKTLKIFDCRLEQVAEDCSHPWEDTDVALMYVEVTTKDLQTYKCDHGVPDHPSHASDLLFILYSSSSGHSQTLQSMVSLRSPFNLHFGRKIDTKELQIDVAHRMKVVDVSVATE